MRSLVKHRRIEASEIGPKHESGEDATANLMPFSYVSGGSTV